MKTLVAGWFSFEQMGATAGDLLACELACEWLEAAGCDYDVATAPPFAPGVDWKAVDPADYSQLVFVCGPFGNGPPVKELLSRFSRCRLMGLNLSLLQALSEWNPFDVLFERDSTQGAHPDISFLASKPKVPLVGRILVHPQKEYRGGLHAEAHEAVHNLLCYQMASVVAIDTRLDENATGLKSAAGVESLIARMDMVVTTRLHGMVLALKNAVPALAIDPIAGGAKIKRQAETIGWPVVFTADALTESELKQAFEFCLTQPARAKASDCCRGAQRQVEGIRRQFIAAAKAHENTPERS